MNWLKLAPAWVWWLLALMIIGGVQQLRVGAGQTKVATARQELADFRLEVSERDRRAAVKARTEEQRRQSVADEEGESARQKLELAEGRAAAAESAAGGLRGEIGRLRGGRSATCAAIATQQRQAGTATVVVLGGLLEESDRMAGDLAKALERSRIAGLACEAVIDRMNPP